MHRRVVLFWLISSIALAQGRGDDWSAFPSAPEPPNAPAAIAPKAPPKKEEVRKEPAPEPEVVSTSERLLPGSEPHSPRTYGNRFDAKQNLRVAPGVVGIGLLHVSSADIGRKGLLRFSVTGESMGQKDFPFTGAENVRSAGTFAVSFVPLDWLEAYLGYAASANSNTSSSPRLIQALGDTTFGAKVAKGLGRGFHGGVDARLLTFSGVGNQGIDRWAVGFAPRLLLTYDVREPLPRFPLRVHGNLGLALDGTGSLVTGHTLKATEEFALGINRFHRFTVGLAAEVPLPWVSPFLEYNLAVPLGVPGGELTRPDQQKIPVGEAMAQTFGLGLKLTAVKDLTLMAAVDFGLARFVGLGVPATPPFNLLFGAAFNVDPLQRGETRLVETVRERKIETPVQEAPKTARVSGKVIDRATQKPISGVIIAAVGSGHPPVASDAETGSFLTHELPEGPVKLLAKKDGYQDAQWEAMLEAGKTATVQLSLEAAVRKALFEVTVSAKKKPVSAKVAFVGKSPHEAQTGGEALKAELPAGRYVVNVTADGHLSQTREVQASEGAKMALTFELIAESGKKLVVVKEDRIELLQQVHFGSAKATILADSFNLLRQVVDAVVKSNIKRVRIEGHTDNKGNKAANQKLSEARAKAIGDYLVAQGIDASRIEAAGLGDTRPVAPNLTARGRELNRRVEFHILER